MRETASVTLVLMAVLLPACGASPTLLPAPEPIGGGVEGPVYLASAEVLVMESFPIQVAVHVTGELPTPCHQLRWSHEVLADEGRINIALRSVAPLGQDCIQVLEPFEQTLQLGAFESGSFEIFINDELIGEFDA